MSTIRLTIGICLLSAPLYAQPAFPPRAQEIVVTLYARNVDLANGNDDQRRALTRKMIEQIVCEFPGQGFGGKSADPTRPFSKDSIARQIGTGLHSWDWQNGTTRQPQVPPTYYDITGQHFIPLGCVNHLADAPSPGPTPVPVPVPSTDVAQVLTELRDFRAETRVELADIKRRADEPAWLMKVVKHPIFVGIASAVTTWVTNRLVTK